MGQSERMTEAVCPVCGDAHSELFQVLEAKPYWRCGQCLATFLDPAARLAPADERAIYELHENGADDVGYRRFLAQLTDALVPCLDPGAEGLDYGCGPGPALVRMLAEQGFQMAAYDPFFAPDTAVLQRGYDFITCTEVAEHWYHPGIELRRLDQMLRPGGWLGVMTRFQTDDSRFAGWDYRRDPTHVVFYRADTWRFMARKMGWHCEIPRANVVLLRKPETEGVSGHGV